MTNSSTKKLTIAVLATLILSLCIFLGFNMTKEATSWSAETRLVKEEILDDESIIGLNIHSLKPNVKIIDNTEDNTITVRQYSRKSDNKEGQFKTSVTNKVLKIEDTSNQWFNFDLSFLFQDYSHELIEIHVPTHRIKSLAIRNGSGELSFPEFNLKTADITLSSGTISGDTLISESLNISTSSGDLEIRHLEGQGRIKISSGKNTLQTLIGNIDLNVSSGNFNAGTYTGKSNIKISSGNVDIGKAQFTDASTIKASSGSVTIGLDSNDPYCFNTNKSSGSINTPQNACGVNDAINLDINITSGSVNLNAH